MAPVAASVTEQRLLRARAARTLLGLHAQQMLAEPERWTWDVLDRLPTWCLFDGERRDRLQRVAGALLMGPELRLWIDRSHLVEAGRLLGDELLGRILVQADELASLLATDDAPAESAASSSLVTDDAGTLDTRFMAAGAAVLVGTLHESLPLGGLADSLGPRAGELSESVARHVLLQAERLMADSPPPRSVAA